MLCPCGTGRLFDECCRPYLDGRALPPTAEALMRARYCAFATHRVEFITATLHPAKNSEHNEKEIRDWSVNSEWHGLEVIATHEGTEVDTRGTVEFIARYKTQGNELAHHETAEFRKIGHRWLFYDGKVRGGEPITREGAEVGRNDPCPCGSGKKYKKCCGSK